MCTLLQHFHTLRSDSNRYLVALPQQPWCQCGCVEGGERKKYVFSFGSGQVGRVRGQRSEGQMVVFHRSVFNVAYLKFDCTVSNIYGSRYVLTSDNRYRSNYFSSNISQDYIFTIPTSSGEGETHPSSQFFRQLSVTLQHNDAIETRSPIDSRDTGLLTHEGLISWGGWSKFHTGDL